MTSQTEQLEDNVLTPKEIFGQLGEAFDTDFELLKNPPGFSQEEEDRLHSAHKHYWQAYRDYTCATYKAFIKAFGERYPEVCIDLLQFVHAAEPQIPLDKEIVVKLASRSYGATEEQIRNQLGAGELESGKSAMDIVNQVYLTFSKDVDAKRKIRNVEQIAKFYNSIENKNL